MPEEPQRVLLTGSMVLGLEPTTSQVKRLAEEEAVEACLGRLPPPARPQVPSLRQFLPAGPMRMPKMTRWRDKARASASNPMGNTKKGCCVISSLGHSVGVWSANDAPAEINATEAEIFDIYARWKAGPGDSGCIISEVLGNMVRTGATFGGQHVKYDAFLSVPHTDANMVKASCAGFGGITLGISLPAEWTEKAVWDLTSSRIVGGHDVTFVDYDDQGVYGLTWGRVVMMTWRALTDPRWVDEAYVRLCKLWWGEDDLTPLGLSYDRIVQAYQEMQGGHAPDIDEPPPPAPPTPPTPPPGPHKDTFTLAGRLAGVIPFTAEGTLTHEHSGENQPQAPSRICWDDLLMAFTHFVAACNARDWGKALQAVIEMIKALGCDEAEAREAWAHMAGAAAGHHAGQARLASEQKGEAQAKPDHREATEREAEGRPAAKRESPRQQTITDQGDDDDEQPAPPAAPRKRRAEKGSA